LAAIQAAACDVTSGETGKLHPLDAPFRCNLPIGLDTPDADALDAYYRHPVLRVRLEV